MANYFDDDVSIWPWTKEMWSKWVLLGDPHRRVMPKSLQEVAKRIELAIETVRKENKDT